MTRAVLLIIAALLGFGDGLHLPVLPRARNMCMHGSCDASEVVVTLDKPLGCAFEEVEAGESAGVLVSEVLKGGSADTSGAVWPGDVLLSVGAHSSLRTTLYNPRIHNSVTSQLFPAGTVDVHNSTFEEVMEELGRGAQLQLVLARAPGRVCRVKFPDGSSAFGAPAGRLSNYAKRSGFRPLYKCGEGLCGSCELIMRADGASEGKSIRMCTGKAPKAGGDWQLSWPAGAGPDGWVK